MSITENQNRAWLQRKLQNYIMFCGRSKIKDKNSYGSRKMQKTIVRELREVVDEFEKNIINKK